MKKLFLILVVSITFLISGKLNAQRLQVGFDIGFSKVVNDNYYSINPNDHKGFGLGLDNLYNISTNLKYGLNFLPVNIAFNLSYVGGSSVNTYWGTLNIYDSHFTKIILESSIDIISIGLGLEYPLHYKDYTPYISVGFLTNYFADLDATQNPKPDDLFSLIPYHFENSFKLGAYLGVGLDYKISNQYSIGLSLKYGFMNLTGKKDFLPFIKESDMNILNFAANFLFNLNYLK